VFPAAYVPGWRGICLPALTLGLNATAFISRMTRSCVLEVIRQDYVRTARAKGLVERVVIYRHVLRSAMVGIVTVVGIQAGSLLAGAIVVESVFSWPGLGLLMVDSLAYRDFPTVQGAVLLVAVMVLTVNLTVDVLYSVIDPRIVY
ncbi:MAG: ABC transporter permease, partial [Candidatus Bipolaricaulis sp.]|nr:ABC transporter permease [Candidatus Bipolaricaulis sp.]